MVLSSMKCYPHAKFCILVSRVHWITQKSIVVSVEILRKIICVFQTSSTTTTTKMTTNQKLYGKDLSAYDDVDVDTLLSQLSPEEINILAKEVDPDVSTLTN